MQARNRQQMYQAHAGECSGHLAIEAGTLSEQEGDDHLRMPWKASFDVGAEDLPEGGCPALGSVRRGPAARSELIEALQGRSQIEASCSQAFSCPGSRIGGWAIGAQLEERLESIPCTPGPGTRCLVDGNSQTGWPVSPFAVDTDLRDGKLDTRGVI